MYSLAVVAAREAQLLANPAMAALYPHGLPSYSLADSDAFTAVLTENRLPDGTDRRRRTPEEEQFIADTTFRCAIDFSYWAERFVYIDDEGHGLRRLYPLWESQVFFLQKLGNLERERWGTHPDGLLLNTLKARQLGMCLDPTTQILTADLRWAALDTLEVGDELVAVDEFPPGGRGAGRSMRTSVVEVRQEVWEDAFELVFDTGVRVVSTGQHRWLTRNRGGAETKWRAVQKMIVGDVVRYITKPWGSPTIEDGWMGGMLDGEGCCQSKRAGAEVSVSQVFGPVYARLTKYFTDRGYASFHHEQPDARTPETSSKYGRRPVGKVSIARMDEIFRLIGQTRPTRFIGRRWWEGKDLPGKRSGVAWARVVEIRPLGRRRMIDLQTSTKTFIAEGLVSHNSTIDEALTAHRILYQPHTRGLSGADVEDQAGYLFRMVTRLYEQLPFFLRPKRLTFVKNREATFENGSFLKTAWGQSTRGALQAVSGQEGTKGAIGRGMTFSTIHISELATWANPSQLDAALLPAIPVSPDTLVLFESTAEHAGDWWHQHWLASGEGAGRFQNVFIPWYAEPKKYTLPAPLDWVPLSTTTQHATKCEQTSPKYLGRVVHLTRDQLYWYETTRAYYEKKGDLGTFLKEFGSDDLEVFQYAGKSIFTFAQLDAIDAAGSRRPLLDVWAVEPARDIAELRRLPEVPASDAGVGGAATRRRPTPPLSPRIPASASTLAATVFPVPPGYGFRRLTPDQLKDLPSLRADVLAIWEYPRTRGRRRYVLAVDVGDGLGSDYSIATIIRLPTIEEPAEEVAQFCSNTIDTQQLAFVCDALGRLYPDEDGIEALAAIETNNHGLATQDTLQLHLGYSHFYVWEYADSASPDRRFSTKIGWVTTTRTRPILLTSFRDAITTFDPISSQPNFVLNSPVTRAELRHFITPTGALADAEHARGQHDDALFASAIGYYVAWRLAGGETEPIAEKRQRRAALQRQAALAPSVRSDWRNSAATAEEQDAHLEDDDEFADDLATDSGLHFSPSGRDRE